MLRWPVIFAISALPLLSGCVVALLPIAAAGAIGKGEIDRAKAKREFIAAGAFDLAINPEATVIVETEPEQHDGKGAGFEISAADLDDNSRSYLSRFFKPIGPQSSPFAGFAAHALEKSVRLEEGDSISSVVLVPRVDIIDPKTIDCAGKPMAVVIDLDHEAQGDWTQAETLYRQNGLIEALRSLRAAKISVIWISDKPVAASETIAAILREGGLAEDNADDFLFLDRGGEDRKQVRRWDAARNYCVLAIAGDKRSDFDELYDYLRNPDGAISLEHMFDNGWFITPPPLVVAEVDEEQVNEK